MEPKFKIGDKVIVLPIADDPDNSHYGDTGECKFAGTIRTIKTCSLETNVFVYDTKEDGSDDEFLEELEFAEYELELYQATKVNITNNDGRDICHWCNGPTKMVQGFSLTYNICDACNK